MTKVIRDWKKEYFAFREFEETWHKEVQGSNVRHLIISAVRSNRNYQYWNIQFRGNGLVSPATDQWNEIIRFREVFQDIEHSGCHQEQPLEDIYQLALRMRISSIWGSNDDLNRFYRGQRCHEWSIVPTIFRNTPTKEELQKSIEKTHGYARAFRARKLELNPQETIAVLQHYSSELELKTWLLDFSWDPFVALFFASHNGQDGDIGTVNYISKGEWNHLSKNGTNPLGPIQIYKPVGVPRILAQRGLFINTSHPALFEQFVPHTLYFRQHEGLVFEDPNHFPPITKDHMYPQNDEYLEIVHTINPVMKEEPFPAIPYDDASRKLSGEDYAKILRSWVPDPDYEDLLCKLGQVHARLQEHADELDITLRSLHRLENIATNVREREVTSIGEAMELTLSRLSRKDPQTNLLKSIIDEFER